MPNSYTMKREDCLAGACPRVYEISASCGFGACPGVHASENSYYVIGRQLSEQEIKEMGLAEKVGAGEALVEIPKDLLDNMPRGRA